MTNNRKRVILTYGTPIIDVEPLHKKWEHWKTQSHHRKYYQDNILYQFMFGDNIEGILKVILQAPDKVKSVEISISISTEDYINCWMKEKSYTYSSNFV